MDRDKRRQLSAADVERVIQVAWGIATRANPMFLATHREKWGERTLRKKAKAFLREGLSESEAAARLAEVLTSHSEG